MQEILSVRYHQQDTDHLRRRVRPDGARFDRRRDLGSGVGLYADNHAHSTLDSYTWHTGPDGLTWTLNDRRRRRSPTTSCCSS